MPTDEPRLPIALVVPDTRAEGPGRRFAVWMQGCPLRCPGCCNPEMLPFAGGTSRSVEDLLSELDAAVAAAGIEGATLLGGEPFAHLDGAVPFARAVRQRGLSVTIFTGYELSELRARGDPRVEALLASCDLLIDGPYDRTRPDRTRRWIGSTNQRIHFLTDRYRADDPCWGRPETLEIRLCGEDLTINGFPAPKAKALWTRPERH